MKIKTSIIDIKIIYLKFQNINSIKKKDNHKKWII